MITAPQSPGDVGTVATPAVSLATSPTTPPTGTGGSAFGNFLSGLAGKATNAVTGSATSFLANGGLIVVGVILGIAALVVSQRQTIIQVGKTVAKAAL